LRYWKSSVRASSGGASAPPAFAIILLSAAAALVSVAAQQSFSGRLSDSTCGASHQEKAGSLTDRQCLLLCIKALSKWALVDQNNKVIPIANHDAMGLPLYAGRLVKLTGESKGDAIVVTRVEAIPAHLHLGHVMTNWRDTPGTRGFLPVAVDEARVALLHARLAAKAAALEEIKLHVGHVLHALDPSVEAKGPGAGYGVKKATAGAQQHLDAAANSEGASSGLKTDAAQVSSALVSVIRSVDQAIAAAQNARTLSDPAGALRAATDLAALALAVDEWLEQAQARMDAILKTEGLFGVPR
jgi:hypothetical protein